MPLIRGRVKDQAGPAADAAVSFAGGPVDLPDIAALTGPDGTFALTAPAPGAYEVVVSFADGFSLRATVDVPPGVQEVEVTLAR